MARKKAAPPPIVRGSIAAPYLFVTLWPESDRALRWLWDAMSDNLNVPVTKCRVVSILDGPPEGANDTPTAAQLARCLPRFRADMAESAPKIVIPMGPHATRHTTGAAYGIEDCRGYVLGAEHMGRTIERVQGQIGVYKTKKKGKYNVGDPRMGTIRVDRDPPLPGNFAVGGCRVLPIYSLRQLQKSTFKLTWAVVADLRRAQRVVDGKFIYLDEQFEYYIRPGVLSNRAGEERAAPCAYPDMVGPYVAFDIETMGIGSDVVKQLSMSDGVTTVAFPWTEEVRTWAQRQFDRPGVTFIGHNLMFDVPRLTMAGIANLHACVLFDTMLAAAMMQPDLPKGLGKVASMYMDIRIWKDMSDRDEDLYSALDSWNTWHLAVHHLIPAMREAA